MFLYFFKNLKMELDSDMEILIYVIQETFRGRIDVLDKKNINQFNQLSLFKNQVKIIDNIINQVNLMINNDNYENDLSAYNLNENKNYKNNEIKKKSKRANSEIQIKNIENGFKNKKNKEKKNIKKINKSVPKILKQINNTEILTKNNESEIKKNEEIIENNTNNGEMINENLEIETKNNEEIIENKEKEIIKEIDKNNIEMEIKNYENDKNKDNDDLTLKYIEKISNNDEKINVNKIPFNNNKKRKSKYTSKYIDSSSNIEKDNSINIKNIIRNNSINRQKKNSKIRNEKKLNSKNNLSFIKNKTNKSKTLKRNKSERIQKIKNEKMDENLNNIIMKNNKDSLIKDIKSPKSLTKTQLSINQLKEELNSYEIKEPNSLNSSNLYKKINLENFNKYNTLSNNNINNNKQNNKNTKEKPIREIFTTEMSSQKDNSLNDLINNYAISTSENRNNSIYSNSTPIKNHKKNTFLNNSPSNINHLTEIPLNYRKNNIFEHINIIKKYFKLSRVQILEQNFLKINSFLREEEQFIFSELCKPLMMRYIVELGQNMEKEIAYYEKLLKDIKDKNKEEKIYNNPSFDFLYSRNFIKAFELLNKSYYIELFRLRTPIPKNKILLVYIIFMSIVKNYRIDIFNSINNKEKFWNKLCEFFVRESVDGEYFGDLIKFLLIKQSDFSLENILNLKQLVKSHLNILFPVNYSKESPTTGIFVYLIRELLEFTGVIESDKTSPYHKSTLYNFYINNLNNKINKLGMLIIKLKLKNKN